MGHTPYGYRIEDGKAVIDPEAAKVVRQIYKSYLSGKALSAAANEAGMTATHSSVKRLLKNRHYLGDDFYPAIIDAGTFQAAEEELTKRATQLGRLNRVQPRPENEIPTQFFMRMLDQEQPSPLLQAEYLYSLIERKVDTGGTE